MISICVLLLIAAGIIVSNNTIMLRRPGKLNLNYLFLYHIFFVACFTLYILKYGGDSFTYWEMNEGQSHVNSDQWFDYFGTGTVFIQFLNFIPVKLLGINYFTGNFIYGTLGFIGIRYIYLLVIDVIPQRINLLGQFGIGTLFYLPNLHFWTAGVGKDTLCFWGIAAFLYGLHGYKRRFPLIALAFFIVYYIRPHMGLILLAGAGAAIIFSGKIKNSAKLILAAVGIGIFILIYDKVLFFLKVEDLSANSLQQLADSKITTLNRRYVGSAVDLASYSVPYRIFTYLFRPLFYDARDFVSLFCSFENFIYLFVFISGVSYLKKRFLKDMPLWMLAGMVIFLLSTVAFSNSLSNLGIVMRMKNMTMIYGVLFILYFNSKAKVEKYFLIRKARERKKALLAKAS